MNFDWTVIWRNAPSLAEGTLLTVVLTTLTMAIAIPGGIVLALMRLSPIRAVSAASAGFVEFFRNLPLILVVYWAYYVMPVAFDVQFSAFTTGLAALALNVSAYNSETFRAGIQSIRKGQVEAALALGMSRAQAVREVVLPSGTSIPVRLDQPLSTKHDRAGAPFVASVAAPFSRSVTPAAGVVSLKARLVGAGGGSS